MGHLKSSAVVAYQKLGLILGGRVFDQHLCPWSGERLYKHWTSVLFPVDPPCSVSTTDLLLQLAVSTVKLAWGWFSPGWLWGAVIHQQRPNYLHRGFANPSSLLACLASFHLAHPLEILIASIANRICLLGFWGKVFWEGFMSCCEELLCLPFFAGLFWGPCTPYTVCLHHAGSPGLWAGAGRAQGMVGLPLSGRAGAAWPHLKALCERDRES